LATEGTSVLMLEIKHRAWAKRNPSQGGAYKLPTTNT
jgi:hypothetical protein